jgi:hypothetical protein
LPIDRTLCDSQPWKEISVDPTTFDGLMRRVARQTTRRAALATLLGGALPLRNTASSNATDRARRKRGTSASSNRISVLKPISIWVDNTAGTGQVGVRHADSRPFRCCRHINDVEVRPGERVLVRSSTPSASVWIAHKYWIEITNPALQRPIVSAAVHGQPVRSDFCCRHRGRTVLDPEDMDIHQTISIRMDRRDFRVTRHRDSNYKEFTLELPADL